VRSAIYETLMSKVKGARERAQGSPLTLTLGPSTSHFYPPRVLMNQCGEAGSIQLP